MCEQPCSLLSAQPNQTHSHASFPHDRTAQSAQLSQRKPRGKNCASILPYVCSTLCITVMMAFLESYLCIFLGCYLTLAKRHKHPVGQNAKVSEQPPTLHAVASSEASGEMASAWMEGEAVPASATFGSVCAFRAAFTSHSRMLQMGGRHGHTGQDTRTSPLS